MLNAPSIAEQQSWFTLSELLDSVLADVIQCDAQFQLSQAQAWQQFSQSLRELEGIPYLDTVDVAVGLGRMESLGLGNLAIDVALERYRPSFLRRCWWGVLRVFGKKVDRKTDQYRFASDAGHAVLTLNIRVHRDEMGRWHVEQSAKEDEQAA